MDVGNCKHGNFWGSRDFTIPAQTAGMIQASRGALNNQSPGQFFPWIGADFSEYICITAQFISDFHNKCTCVFCISTEFFDGRIRFQPPALRRVFRSFVLDIGSTNHDGQQITHRIYHNVSFPSFRFFLRRSRPAFFPCPHRLYTLRIRQFHNLVSRYVRHPFESF